MTTVIEKPGFSNWVAPRKETLRWIAAGWGTFVVVAAIAWQVWPRMAPLEGAMDRLLLAVQLCAAPGLFMMMVLQTLWRVADTPEAEDPLAGAESRRFQINQRVFSNTVEQILIFVPIFLALSVRLDAVDAFVLPLLMGLWCAGRLMFWIGYNIGNNQRAIGMDWTSGAASLTAVLFALTFLN